MALSKSPKKHRCPQCGHMSFTYYVDDQENIIHPESGRCDREDKCGYHRSPKDFGLQNQIQRVSAPQVVEMKYDTIGMDIVALTERKYEKNNFVKWLRGIVGESADELVKKYRVGTSTHWDGATVFWQVDHKGDCRSGKVMLYDENTGRRVKEPKNMVTFAHAAMGRTFKYQACLFGEHLIGDATEMICVVESEKTALIASHFFPEYTWVATGGKDCLKQSVKMNDKLVILFPDCKCTEKWTKVAAGWNIPREVKVCDFLDRYASDEDFNEGADIADYLLKDREFAGHLKDVIADMVTKRPWEEYLIDVTKAMERPHTMLSFDGEMLFSAGNIQVITGAAKSRKTFLVTHFAGEYLKQHPEGEILWIDTEQAQYDAQQMVLRLYRLLDLSTKENDPRIKAMMLRECDDPRKAVFEAIEYYKSPYIIIDGTADLMKSINDEEDAVDIVKQLMKYSSMYNSCIVNVVHQNRNDANTRGWLGSVLEKKAETVLLVKSNGDTSKVVDKYNRHLCPVNFDFKVENGLPVRVETKEEQQQLTRKELNLNYCVEHMKPHCKYSKEELRSMWYMECPSDRTFSSYMKELMTQNRITKHEIDGKKYYERTMEDSTDELRDEAEAYYQEALAFDDIY